MVELLFHAGTHKTGTTAIQHCAYYNRVGLAAQGIMYPDLGSIVPSGAEAHHEFAHAAAGKGKHLSLSDARCLASSWHESARKSGSRILISAEPAYRHTVRDAGSDWLDRRRAYLRRLGHLLQAFDIEVIVVLRRQDEFVRSLYQEHVTRGTSKYAKLTFPEYRKEAIRTNLRFLDNLRMFDEYLGRIRLLTYEGLLQGGRFLTSFFAELGATNLSPNDSRVVRPSLSVAETLIKQRINRHVATRAQNEQLLKWLRSWRVQRVLKRNFAGKKTLWENPSVRRAFLDQYIDDNEIIRETYLPGRRELFPAFCSGHDSDRGSSVDPAHVHQALREALRASPRQFLRIFQDGVFHELDRAIPARDGS